MRLTHRLILAGLAIIIGPTCGATVASAADVSVTVEDIRNADGNILLSICDRAHFLKGGCLTARTKAQVGSLVMVMKDVPPGTYAIQLIHDENLNGDIDRDFFGIPVEAYAFSNGNKVLLAPPDFEDCAVTLGTEPFSISIPLRH